MYRNQKPQFLRKQKLFLYLVCLLFIALTFYPNVLLIPEKGLNFLCNATGETTLY